MTDPPVLGLPNVFLNDDGDDDDDAFTTTTTTTCTHCMTPLFPSPLLPYSQIHLPSCSSLATIQKLYHSPSYSSGKRASSPAIKELTLSLKVPYKTQSPFRRPILKSAYPYSTTTHTLSMDMTILDSEWQTR